MAPWHIAADKGQSNIKAEKRRMRVARGTQRKLLCYLLQPLGDLIY